MKSVKCAVSYNDHDLSKGNSEREKERKRLLRPRRLTMPTSEIYANNGRMCTLSVPRLNFP